MIVTPLSSFSAFARIKVYVSRGRDVSCSVRWKLSKCDVVDGRLMIDVRAEMKWGPTASSDFFALVPFSRALLVSNVIQISERITAPTTHYMSE